MNKITGRIIHKSVVKKGHGEYGEWRVIDFIIEKSFKKKKYKALFSAKGRLADFIEQTPLKEKLTIHYVIDSREYKGRWFTDLRATEIEKYVKKNFQVVRLGDEIANKSELESNTDLQLPFTDSRT